MVFGRKRGYLYHCTVVEVTLFLPKVNFTLGGFMYNIGGGERGRWAQRRGRKRRGSTKKAKKRNPKGNRKGNHVFTR